MDSFNTHNNVKMVDTSLVNKILEHGQKLRNAMVGSILKNDPFNTDIIYNKHFNTPETSKSDLNFNLVNSIDTKRVEAYIRGEYMTKTEERLALDTLRSMSAPDLCKTTERTLNSTCLSSCKCYTCEQYNSNNIHCDIRRKHKEIIDSTNQDYSFNEVTKDIQEKYNLENRNMLKHVDSLKVSINNLILNEVGNQKVSGNVKKVPYNFNETYFLEYRIPDYIVNKCSIRKSKVDSGLENSCVRFCSRRSHQAIHFKQVTIHDIKKLNQLNLDECEIVFRISYRTQKQKNASDLGFAKFNFGSFLLSKNLVCNRNLPVFLNDNSPIVVGHLKLSVLLGCGRLYFGQELVDALNSFEQNSVVLDSDDSTNRLNQLQRNNRVTSRDIGNIKEQTYQCEGDEENGRIIKENVTNVCHEQEDLKNNLVKSVPSKPVRNSNKNKYHDLSRSEFKKSQQIVKEPVGPTVGQSLLRSQFENNEKQILFGFLYISEVQYLSSPISSYITCRPFCQNETSCSKLVTDTSNPVLNFSQLVPLIYEDELLQLLRENYMVIEFWKKINSTHVVIGLTKVPLHQFYLAYRNPVFVKYLSKNKLPIIDTDWWEPIYSVETQDIIIGQVQLLIALGTEVQINNLKSERGFTNNVVKARYSAPRSKTKYDTKNEEELNVPDLHFSSRLRGQRNTGDLLQLKRQYKNKYNLTNAAFDSNKLSEIKRDRSFPDHKEPYKFTNVIDKAVNTSSPEEVQTHIIKTFDVGVQSNLDMDTMVDAPNENKISPTQEMLGSFLNQLMVAQKQKNIFVENSTNTEEVETSRSNRGEMLQNAQDNTNTNLRRTTDLLDSLEKALSLDGLPIQKSSQKIPGTFKASIRINGANHLPSRKKCKSKKSRNRSVKNEDNLLPSCYVTFEVSENDLKITPVILKSTSPSWNYKCDTNLPEDLLTNSQRRLIFKVWRKATNTVSSPNMQTDIVLGFAAVDLTILLVGFPNVQGWFNIIDFTGKCNGQIHIHITPLEDLSKYKPSKKDDCSCNAPDEVIPTDNPKPEDDAPSELLSRALKRKFTELDEITQRLRLRLSKVTNDGDSDDTSSDGVAEEFEKDINTLCIEEDFDLIDFEEEARKSNFNYDKENTSTESSTNKLHALLTIKEDSSSSKESEHMLIVDESKVSCSGSTSDSTASLSRNTGGSSEGDHSTEEKNKALSLDKTLQEGKQKIDTLLEKLSLISTDTNNTFASRYVSGCSLNNECNALNIDTEAILKELDHFSRPNIHSSLGFEPLKFQQLYGGSSDGNGVKKGSNLSQTSNSDTSVITNFSDCRPVPDGQGNISDDQVDQN